ncbi:MAG: nucleotidyltransferase domain-containing protein [Bacteroidales bacterium]|nr:nucleotidyltransferase domain-containing protein [Bacteroidales bacterium]MBQ3618618.1 nucleotidyltransferase domain-containing protein [Bacteroidales bacterium]
MKYGLDDKYFNALISVFPRHPEVESVILYGSRAKGNYKPFSDIDITLKGSNLTRQHLGQIFTEIDDLLLPYFLDISIYNKLTDKGFIEAIDKTGVEIYRKNMR